MAAEKNAKGPLRSFNDLLLNTTEEVLGEVFGEGPSHSMFRYISLKLSIAPGEVSAISHILHSSLHDVLGDGAEIVEDLIIKKLYELFLELGWRKRRSFKDLLMLLLNLGQRKKWGFTKRIEDLRKNFEEIRKRSLINREYRICL